MKKYYPDSTDSAALNLAEMNDMFLGEKLPVPDLETKNALCIGPYTVVAIVSHKIAPGRPSPFNVQYRFRRENEPPSNDKWFLHRRQVPKRCNELIKSYSAEIAQDAPDVIAKPQTLHP